MTKSTPLPASSSAVAKGRVDAVHAAARAVGVDTHRDIPHVVPTSYGDVRIEKVTRQEDPWGVTWIEVWLEGGSAPEPHWRIFNPPTLVRDPAGDVVIAGQRYRKDPLAAVAETIAANGGAAQRRIR